MFIEGNDGSVRVCASFLQLKAFIAATPEQGSGARAFQQAVDRTKSNMAWRDKNEASVVAWLQSYVDNKSWNDVEHKH